MSRRKTVKYIFVTGGVVSSIGKGILSASLGSLLKNHGFQVTIQKYDPYLNIDPGTMSPYQHGEVFVTDDGTETDLDLGHYERFLDTPTFHQNNVTMGQIYSSILDRERRGDFLGATVQVVPHVVDEIKSKLTSLEKTGAYDIIITEIGGTVGDIESSPFLEAMRQLRLEYGAHHFINIHLTLVPFLKKATELKTKPTQHSVKMLLEIGVQPDILVCRSEQPLPQDIKQKIGLFCNLDSSNVISFHDIETIYEAPLILRNENITKLIFQKWKIRPQIPKPSLSSWETFVNKIKEPSDGVVRIGLCGKYVEYPDAYKSILESFIHAGADNRVSVDIHFLRSEDIEDNSKTAEELIKQLDGVLIAPGFGYRGVEGKIAIINYARERKIPLFGICLGMQCMVIEFSRNVCGLERANSSEFDKKANQVVNIMKSQRNMENKGGTMRLGSYPCIISEGTMLHKIYKKTLINERHRHRHEINNTYRDTFKEKGLILSGLSPDNTLIEAIEISNHPWFIGVQFHPEFKSCVNNTHPLFSSFIESSKKYRDSKK